MATGYFFDSPWLYGIFHDVVEHAAFADPGVLTMMIAPCILAMLVPTILSYWPHGGKPQKFTHSEPPDEKTWRAMPFISKVDYAAQDIAAHSPDVGFYTYWMHMRFWILGCIYNAVALYMVPCPADMSGPDWVKQAVIKSIILHHVGEGLGYFKQGPLWGHRWWPDAWKYQLTPGTMKQGMFGDRRNYLDVAVHAVFFFFSIVSMWLPRMPLWWLLVIIATSVYCCVADFHMWLQRVAYTYSYFFVAACFPYDQGGLAGMQLVMLFQRLGCGIGKLGPWFCYVIGIFMQSHPTCRDSENYRSLIHEGPNSFGPSKFIKRLGYFAECWETFWPLVVFFTFCPVIPLIGAAGLLAMHTFIIIAPAFIDVVMWNVAFMIGDAYLFVYACRGFDWQGFWNMHPLLAGLLLTDFVCTTVMMQYPKVCSRYFRHAHYTGNWPQCVFLVKKEAAEKMWTSLKVYGNSAWDVYEEKHGLRGEYQMYKNMAYAWLMNLDAKMLPSLMLKAIGEDNLQDYYFTQMWHFGECFGGAGCDGQQGPKFAKALHRACHLQPKDLMVVYIWAFPVFQAWYDPDNTKAEWEIHDATEVLPIETGAVNMRALQSCDSLPSAGLKLVKLIDDETAGACSPDCGA